MDNVVDRARELLVKIDQRPWKAEVEPETWCDAGDDGRTIGGYTGEMEQTGAIIVENNDEDGTVTYIADRVWAGNFPFVLAAPDLVRGLIGEVDRLRKAWPIKGVRVDDDKVVIAVKGGNEAARQLCGELLARIPTTPAEPQIKPV